MIRPMTALSRHPKFVRPSVNREMDTRARRRRPTERTRPTNTALAQTLDRAQPMNDPWYPPHSNTRDLGCVR